MKNLIQNLGLRAGQLDRQQIQLIFLIVSLSLLVIGATAPAGSGGGIPGG
jgi:hypothetical protein